MDGLDFMLLYPDDMVVGQTVLVYLEDEEGVTWSFPAPWAPMVLELLFLNRIASWSTWQPVDIVTSFPESSQHAHPQGSEVRQLNRMTAIASIHIHLRKYLRVFQSLWLIIILFPHLLYLKLKPATKMTPVRLPWCTDQHRDKRDNWGHHGGIRCRVSLPVPVYFLFLQMCVLWERTAAFTYLTKVCHSCCWQRSLSRRCYSLSPLKVHPA